MQLDLWRSDIACFKESVCVGLSVHLWGREFFKMLGDACGGFVVVDEEMKERLHLNGLESSSS